MTKWCGTMKGNPLEPPPPSMDTPLEDRTREKPRGRPSTKTKRGVQVMIKIITPLEKCSFVTVIAESSEKRRGETDPPIKKCHLTVEGVREERRDRLDKRS